MDKKSAHNLKEMKYTDDQWSALEARALELCDNISPDIQEQIENIELEDLSGDVASLNMTYELKDNNKTLVFVINP